MSPMARGRRGLRDKKVKGGEKGHYQKGKEKGRMVRGIGEGAGMKKELFFCG